MHCGLAQERSLLWKTDAMQRIMSEGQTYQAKIHAFIFGMPVKKVYDLRGTWPVLDIIGRVSQQLVPAFAHRVVSRCTKPSGKCFGMQWWGTDVGRGGVERP